MQDVIYFYRVNVTFPHNSNAGAAEAGQAQVDLKTCGLRTDINTKGRAQPEPFSTINQKGIKSLLENALKLALKGS
jgi:hypothetical protein